MSEVAHRPALGAEDTTIEHGSAGRDTFSVTVTVVCLAHAVLRRWSHVFVSVWHVGDAMQNTVAEPQSADPKTEVPKTTAICADQGGRPEAQDYVDAGHVRGAGIRSGGSIRDIEVDARAKDEECDNQD